MTRRGLFAAIAAVFARKVPRAAYSAPRLELLGKIDDFAKSAILPQINETVFRHLNYGLGITFSREVLENDRLHWLTRAMQRAAERQRYELERLVADDFEQIAGLPAETLGRPPDVRRVSPKT